MPSTYTTNLGIEKIGTGEQSGTWGNTTNTNFDIIDQAVNGITAFTVSSTDTGNPTLLQINEGAISEGRNAFIEFTSSGDLGAAGVVQLTPNDAEKIVYVRNSLGGSQSLILFQGAYNASNDYVVPNGFDVLLKFSGTGSGSTVTAVQVNPKFDGTMSVAGDVGIGTSAPSVISANATTLEIKGAVTTKAGAIRLSSSDDSVQGYIYPDSASGFSMGSLTNDDMLLRTNSTTRATIEATTGDMYLGATTGTGFNGKLVVSDGAVGGQTFIDVANDSNNNQFLKVGISNNNGIIAVDDGDDLIFGKMTDASQTSLSTELGKFDTSGNLTVTGTIEGRDVAADGTKLDGIDDNANDYVHPSDGGGNRAALTGATVYSDITINTLGHVTATAVRNMTLADLGYTGATDANNYALPKATAAVRGGVELGSNTVQTVGANAVSATAGKTYAVQLNSADQMVVNVPWSDSTNPGTVTSIATGTGIAGGTITTSGTISLDFAELTDMTADISGSTQFILQNGTTESRKAASEIKLSNFNNNLGWTSNTGDITNVSAGVGLSGGGSSGSVTLTLDMSELTDMTATMVGTDQFIVLDNSADRRKAANEIGLSIFNNDAGFTTNTGDITGVTAGTGLTGGGTSGSVTLNVAAGVGLHVNANDVALYSTFAAGGTQTIQDEEFIVVTSAGQTITLPASPSQGDTVYISVGNFTNTVVNGNGRDIMADPSSLTIDVANIGITLVYYDATQGWRLM